MRHLFSQAKDLIAGASHILLLTDERIDGDTIGSTLGLYHTLTTSGKRCTIYSPKPLDSYLQFVPGHENIVRDAQVFTDPTVDLLIICDCSDGKYIEALLPTMPHKVPLIVFDHHATNPMYGTLNIVEPTAASSADLTWRFVQYAEYEVTPEAAQCFLTGICTDTILFSTSGTTTDAVNASADLVRLGADMRPIVRNTLMNRSLAAMRLWGTALERLFLDPIFGGVGTAITRADMQRTGANDEDASGISNFLHAMLDKSYDAVAVYRESDDGGVKGSVRSRGKNVAEIAEKHFGGGGHKVAAGFKVPNASLKKDEAGIWHVKRVA
ncbi:DHH family phosphoesterase [Patescibacteria group bacterium]|nr:DHH family phosphoesterase [Patescibacteria group bacterium]